MRASSSRRKPVAIIAANVCAEFILWVGCARARFYKMYSFIVNRVYTRNAISLSRMFFFFSAITTHLLHWLSFCLFKKKTHKGDYYYDNMRRKHVQAAHRHEDIKLYYLAKCCARRLGWYHQVRGVINKLLKSYLIVPKFAFGSILFSMRCEVLMFALYVWAAIVFFIFFTCILCGK